MTHGLGHALFVLPVGLVLIRLASRRPHLAGAAALVLLTVDLAVANSRFVLTVAQPSFDTPSDALRVIAEAERNDPSPGPFRIHRPVRWYPVGWRTRASKSRFDEAIIWDRDTLYPKYGINFGSEYTQSAGVGQLREYDRFFQILNTQVVDEQAARLLNIGVGEQVIYNPRRSYDMWNTRYFIVAFDSNGWRDPLRASASFLFRSAQIYPDPGLFTGPGGKERAKNWAETRDFKVIRNLVEFPRAWVVHGARPTRAVRHALWSEEDETLREMLYEADPIWNNGRDRVFDPRKVAWMSRGDWDEVRAGLSGLPTSPSEAAKVTYPTPQQVVVDVDLSSPGLVILADAYYPGWELTVDGKSAPIYRVNLMMRGAAVAAGHHRLVYTYAPLSFTLGGVISVGGITAFLAVGLACARRPVDAVLGPAAVFPGA
jgi:hypothetical protein